MKKNAFTISELLIALGLIGVIAAVSVPMISNIMPDQTKAKVIKYNEKIATYTNDLLDNDGVYYRDKVDPRDASRCIGLECEGIPIVDPFKDDKYSGDDKYVNLMKYMLGINDDNELPDGSVWTITRVDPGIYSIEINVDGEDKGTNCVFANDCKNPDIFKFNIDKYGRVTAGDALTDAYLHDATNYRNKKADVALAETYLKSKSYDAKDDNREESDGAGSPGGGNS